MSSQVLSEQVSAQTVFARLLHAHGSLMRDIGARLAAEHGLSANDFETLLHLSKAEGGEMRRIDLAERLRLTPSGVTRLLNGLEESGLTDRGGCPTDARVTYATITDKGRETLARAACTHAAMCNEVIGANLSPAELNSLGELLARLPGVDDIDEQGVRGRFVSGSLQDRGLREDGAARKTFEPIRRQVEVRAAVRAARRPRYGRPPEPA